jgi:hypothetical protein
MVRRMIISAALLIIVFMLGFAPIWGKSRESSSGSIGFAQVGQSRDR